MTYVELYHKAVKAFDPAGRGIVKGAPVEVLFSVSRLADKQGWDQQVDSEQLNYWLLPDYLDAQSVTTVLDIVM